MIIRMIAWLDEHGYNADPMSGEGVIWSIDRHYPGGFSKFLADFEVRRSSR